MKTLIRHDGTLVIAAETQIESYALRKWADENLPLQPAPGVQPKVLVHFPSDVFGPCEEILDWHPGMPPHAWKAI